MKTFRYILSIALCLAFSTALSSRLVCLAAGDREWDKVLDRYESLCDECLVLRRRVDAGEKVSSRALSKVIFDLEKLREVLKSAGGSMSREQMERFESIRRRYTVLLQGGAEASPEAAAAETSGKVPRHGPDVAGADVSSRKTAEAVNGQSARDSRRSPVPSVRGTGFRKKEVETELPEQPAALPREEFPAVPEVNTNLRDRARAGRSSRDGLHGWVSGAGRPSSGVSRRQEKGALRIGAGFCAGVAPDLSYGIVLSADFRNTPWGVYGKFRSNFRSAPWSYECLSDGTSGGSDVWFSGSSAVSKMQLSGGVRFRPLRRLGVYAGAGFGSYVTAWEDASRKWARVSDYSARGLLLEGGLSVPVGALELFAGVSATALRYTDLELGLMLHF